MNFRMGGNSMTPERVAGRTTHPEYAALPDALKAIHSEHSYAWLGEERQRIVERETMPDWDVTE